MRSKNESISIRIFGPLLVAAFWALLLFGCAQREPGVSSAAVLQ